MKVIVVGTGTIGSAVGKVLKEHGHEVVSVGRKSGDYRADISDMTSLKKLFGNVGPFEAVANAAGDVFLVRSKNSPTTNGRSRSSVKEWGRSTLCAPRCRTSLTRDRSRSSQAS